MTDAELALAAFRSFPGSIAVLDGDGRIRLTNRAWSEPDAPVSRLVGRTTTPGEPLVRLLRGVPDREAEEVAAMLQGVLSGDRTTSDLLIRPEGADGVRHRYRVVLTPGGRGGERMVMLTVRDLGRGEHEMAAEGIPGATEATDPGAWPVGDAAALTPITESPTDIFWVQAPDHSVMHFMSPAFELVFGRSRDEVMDDPTAFVQWVHADDRERVRADLWEDAGGARDTEFRIVRPDGTVRWLHSRAFPVRDDSGAVVRIAGVTSDITDQRQASQVVARSESRYRAIFESSPVGIALVAPDGEILEANPALRRLLESEAAAGRNALDLFGSDERGQVAEVLERMGRDGAAGWTRETRFRREDHGPISVRVQISPSSVERGESVAVLLVEDVSDRKRLELQLRQAQRIESVGRLAGGIAHDFNNLVTVIRGHTDLILDELSAGDPLRQDLLDIRQAGERAAALTGQLLAFSRRNVLQPRVVNLNEVVHGLRVLLRRALGEDVSFEIDAASDLGLVRTDPAQMEQILLNLAINARDAMATGGSVTIRTFNRELDQAWVDEHLGSTPGPHVAISLTDTGHGMDRETLSLIFEPFFTTKEPGKGTGLGLAMAYGIVKQSGGYIDVESEVGEGSTFTIYLPRVEDVTPEDRPAWDEAGERLPGTETILVVEDEPQVRSLTARVLEARGYAVLAAESGQEAMVKARAFSGRIHLLITDVVMPGMGGSELAERLQQERPETRVLFTSGYADDAIVRHGVFRRDMPFLPKPFTPSELGARVRAVLDEGR